MKKVHMQDIRLNNNAGVSVPVCMAFGRLLDPDKSHWEITAEFDKVTCRSCQRIFKRRYPWAKGK